MLLHLEKKTIRFPVAFARKQGTNGSSAPGGSAVSAVKPDTTLTNVPRWQRRTLTWRFWIMRAWSRKRTRSSPFLNGEHEFRFGCSGGTEGLGCEIGEIETWVVDSTATRHMAPNPVSMTNYRKCDGVVRTANDVANDAALPIEGVGDILMSFRSDFGETDLRLLNVAFVPLLSHNLLSLKQFTRRAGHSYRGDGDGVTLFCKSDRWLFAPTVGKHDRMRACRARSDSACAAIAPTVKTPNIGIEVNINEFHYSFGHVHKELLLETTKQRGVTLTGALQECEGCSMAKRRRKPIAKTTKSRADKA